LEEKQEHGIPSKRSSTYNDQEVEQRMLLAFFSLCSGYSGALIMGLKREVWWHDYKATARQVKGFVLLRVQQICERNHE
jgi:hypothetical protein